MMKETNIPGVTSVYEIPIIGYGNDRIIVREQQGIFNILALLDNIDESGIKIAFTKDVAISIRNQLNKLLGD